MVLSGDRRWLFPGGAAKFAEMEENIDQDDRVGEGHEDEFTHLAASKGTGGARRRVWIDAGVKSGLFFIVMQPTI